MTIHDHLHRAHARKPLDIVAREPEAKRDDPLTYVSVVYVTASKTFAGAVGSYTTMGVIVNPDATTSASSTSTSTTPESSSSSTKSSSKASTLATSTSSSVVSSITPASSSSIATSLLVATSSASVAVSSTLATTASAASSTASEVSKSTSSGGMSSGGKAGLAIGILLLIGAALSIALFCFKKRKDKLERMDDEKMDAFAVAAQNHRSPSIRTNATAPRLSLRPVTQFLPLYGEKRQSQGHALAMTPSPASAPTEKQSHWERPMGGQDANRSNPFGNHAETIDSANADGPAVVGEVSPNGELVLGAAAGAAAVGLARGASKRGVKPLDFTKQGPFMSPPSPTGTEFSETSEGPGTPRLTTGGAAIAAAGGPANSAVHRVQLDFMPSMDDELELRAGQLIRMLHEYDDGWALCIRLDRSRQGVVPRTCLSTRPVKPRPQQNGPRGGPPPNMRIATNGRVSPPAKQSPGPMTPNKNGPRPMSPGQLMTPVNGSPQARPMTPNGPQYTPQRPTTPVGQQSRPMTPSSSAQQARPMTPTSSASAPRITTPIPSSPMSMKTIGQSGPPPAARGAVIRKPVGTAM